MSDAATFDSWVRQGKWQLNLTQVGLPLFIEQTAEPNAAETALFVGRDEPLAKLESWLQAALDGQGRLAFISGEAGWALVRVGEYHEALPFLRDAAVLARQIRALDMLLRALRYQAAYFFWLDHWDGVMDIDRPWRALEQRFPNFAARAGPTGYRISLIAAVRTLEVFQEISTLADVTSVQSALDSLDGDHGQQTHSRHKHRHFL